ncbi:MAG: nuclear transport factor 2 family protein [Thermoleophilaceae bacterium]
MPPGSVELVREIIEALNRGDVEAMLARMDADFEWRPLRDSPVSRTYRGHEQVRRYVEDWLSTFEDLRMELEGPIAVGDYVVVVVRSQGRGRASRIELYGRFCQVWMMRRGRAARMTEYATRDEGLEALR